MFIYRVESGSKIKWTVFSVGKKLRASRRYWWILIQITAYYQCKYIWTLQLYQKNTLDKLFHKNFRALKMTLTKLVNRVFDQRLHFNEASTGFFFILCLLWVCGIIFILDNFKIKETLHTHNKQIRQKKLNSTNVSLKRSLW